MVIRYLKYLSLIIIFVQALPAQAQEERQSELKAYYLYTFSSYATWEDGVSDTIFTIGVLGETDLLQPLQRIAAEKTVNAKPLVIKYWETVDEIESCQILFIAHSMRKNLKMITEKIADQQILTVGDSKGFARQGVCLNFFIEGEHLRFEINRKAIEQQDIYVSSQLLKLGKII